MLKHSLTRRSRAALIATAATAALMAFPVTASAEPLAGIVQPADAASTNDADNDLLRACPIDGAATYEDSWGWARSGGRSHEGVDMIADRGAPVVAVRGGDALFKRNRLGGNAVWLTAPNGDKFYYAHLDSFAGDSRTVQAGDVIGFVGSTGNAGGTHLHFETLPGDRVENPYPHTLAACVPTSEEIATIAQYEANALNDTAVWERFLPSA